MTPHAAGDKQQRTVFVTATGEIEVMDIGRMGRRLQADPDFDPSFSELLDLQGLVPPHFLYTDLQTIAYEMDPFPSTSRRALVAPEGLMYGIARMYQMVQGDDNICVFQVRDEALTWLGLEKGG